MSLWSRITSTLWRSKPEAKDLLRLWRIRFWMGLLALVAAWGLQVVLQQKGFLEHFDEFDADQYARSDALPTEYSGRITIVAVNEHDYHDAHLFAAKSPLDPKKLKELISEVQDYRPRIIGIDFLTGDWQIPLGKSNMKTEPPIVWARDGEVPDEQRNENVGMVWNGVAGYSQNPPTWLRFAVPVNQPDSDGVIRHYPRTVKTREPDGQIMSDSPTMAQVLASSFPYEQPDCRPADRPAGECRIRFTGENHKFMILPASAVLHDHATDRRFSKYLDGRIVLIGGTYAAGRDRYASGGRYYSGVEILAHEIESELTGPIYEVPSRVAFSVSLGLSVILYTIAFHLPPILDLPFSFVFLCVFSFGSGWILYHYDHRFFPIGSALLSLPFGIIVEHCVGCRFLEQLLQPREAEG